MTAACAPHGDLQREGSAVCLNCGLCCRNIWFDHAIIADQERDRAAQAGLEIEINAGRPSFRLPCPLYAAGRCSAYMTWRPGVCARYRCKLLRRYMKGDCTRDEALHQVNRIEGLAAAIRDRLGNQRERLHDLIADVVEARYDALREPELLLDVTTLMALYRHHFDHRFGMMDTEAGPAHTA